MPEVTTGLTRERGPGLRIVLLGILLGGAVFLAGSLAGYIKPNYSLLENVSEKAGLIMRLPPLLRPLGIFLNNIVAATLTYILTIILIIPGISVIAINGYIVGTAVRYAVEEGGLSLLTAILLIIPHGILEIPAFLAAVGFGMRCLAYCRGVKRIIENTLSMYAVTAPLLLIAAFIEIFVTPVIAGVGGLGG
ncbi:conserved hypothetical protein [Aeropyrum pernix]|uniref:Stage II sporulation protein M n=1 Tax=Aeropyrum pernix TaxID=56636 RepID=A0A401H7Q8_AERPX|nr:conserved hypothetical protein [Aeropyrum pernix]